MKILASFNWPITLSSLLLLSVGILVIYSSSPNLALQQSSYALFGLIIYLVLSLLDYSYLRVIATPLYALILFFLLAVLILGTETRGSLRWLPLFGFTIQPSEFAKPALILVLAAFWANNLPSWRALGKSLLLVVLPVFLVFKQPSMGVALTILAIWFGMLSAVQLSFKKVFLILLICALIFPLLYLMLADYQKQRILGFFAPGRDPLGIGYNQIQSTIAVGSGQFLGRGLGRGPQSRLQFLPEARTDFIFASIAEEMGLLGSIIILSLFLFLFVYCLKVAENAKDLFGLLIVFGGVSMLLFQTVVNIGMNIGIVPITGITLPLVSFGGNSLIATFITLGLMSSVAKHKRRIDKESD